MFFTHPTSSGLRWFTLLGLLVYAQSASAQLVARMSPTLTPDDFHTPTGYLEYLPEGHLTSGKKYPVIVFLHGLGEKGDGSDGQIWRVANVGPPRILRNWYSGGQKGPNPMTFTVNGKEETFILICPQLSSRYGGFDEMLHAFMPFIFEHYAKYIDRSRVYLTGLSMGGGGVWRTPTLHPEWFAAIAPICAANWPDQWGGPAQLAAHRIPVWAFHNQFDGTVGVNNTLEWIKQIENADPKPVPAPKVTIYPTGGHDAWSSAYRTDNGLHTPNLYQWFLGHTKTSPAPTRTVIWDGKRWEVYDLSTKNWIATTVQPTDDVVMAGQYPLSGTSFTCNNLNVERGGKLHIGSGVTITVNGQLRIDGGPWGFPQLDGEILVANGGSLVQTTNSTLGLMGGKFRVQRQRNPTRVTGAGVGYNFCSAPVNGLSGIHLPGAANLRFWYSETGQRWQPANSLLQPGLGYTAGMAGTDASYELAVSGWPTGNLTYGKVNNGNIGINVTKSPGLFSGYNLLGNPYPSAIDLNLFFADPDNSELDGTAWLWNDGDQGSGQGNYLVANRLTNINAIPAGQGFFALAKNNGYVMFKNAHRKAGNNQEFYRTEGEEVVLERLSLRVAQNEGNYDELHLGFSSSFTEREDRSYDAVKIDNPSGLNVSFQWQNKRWAGLALPSTMTDKAWSVPLTVQVRTEAEYTIKALENDQPLGRPMFLEDRATNEYYLMQAEREHKISIRPGVHTNRFFLRFGNEVVGDRNENVPVRAYSYGKDLYLLAAKGKSGNAKIVIYNSMGNLVQQFDNVWLDYAIRQVPTQIGASHIYIVEITLNGETFKQRVWLEK
ncbi:MAG: hypothetical protein MUC97_01225 [Bernardetiaceae bacterium]|jgi:hypothetical protein|nr:hypothetical protein [Bernardetiaceae bacterium]